MARLDDAEQVQFETRAAWREWLAQNHATSSGVWAIYCKKSADRTGPDYEDLVREALCFGWIDSTARRVDDARTRLYFCPRKRGGGWAATNKARIAELTAEGRMTPAGQAVVDQAIADESWNALDQSEALEVPTELARAFRTYPGSRAQWAAFPPGVRKQLIYWVTAAKRPETRAVRADETARLAQQGIRANQWVPRDRR